MGSPLLEDAKAYWLLCSQTSKESVSKVEEVQGLCAKALKRRDESETAQRKAETDLRRTRVLSLNKGNGV